MIPNLKAFGNFARAVAIEQSRTTVYQGMEYEKDLVLKSAPDAAIRKTAINEGSGVTGGYLVPEQLKLDIDTLISQQIPFLDPLVGYVQPMETAQLFVPGVDIAASNATGSPVYYGGINPTPVKEAATPTETDPSWTGANLIARDIECYVVASNQLVKDGGEALGAYLLRLFYLSLTWKACYYFCQGNGADQPAGIIGAPSSLLVTRQSSSTVTNQDIASLAGSLLPGSYSRGVWLINPSAYVKIAQLTQYLLSGHVPPTGEGKGMVGALLTRPVYVTDQLPKVGTKGDVIFYDPKLYCVGYRSLDIAASDIPNFLTNQTVFRLILRCDGQPLAKSTVTLADGNTAAGIAAVLN